MHGDHTTDHTTDLARRPTCITSLTPLARRTESVVRSDSSSPPLA
jgi:hypothetical protein